MSEIKLIFIRHGEAENAWGHHEDPGLSEKGLSQAKNLINHKNLSNLEDYCFISSPKSMDDPPKQIGPFTKFPLLSNLSTTKSPLFSSENNELCCPK